MTTVSLSNDNCSTERFKNVRLHKKDLIQKRSFDSNVGKPKQLVRKKKQIYIIYVFSILILSSCDNK